MSDIICRKCSEPWEQYYLAHEGLFDDPGSEAPAYLQEAHEAINQADDDHYHSRRDTPPEHYKMGGELLVKAVLKGEGCPSCWYDPSRATNDEDTQLDALRHNLFDSAWDGDPAELF